MPLSMEGRGRGGGRDFYLLQRLEKKSPAAIPLVLFTCPDGYGRAGTGAQPPHAAQVAVPAPRLQNAGLCP